MSCSRSSRKTTHSGIGIFCLARILYCTDALQILILTCPPSKRSLSRQDGREYPAILFDGRLDIDVLKDQLAQDGLILSKLGGKIPYCNGNGLSRIVFTATITKATTVRHPGEANSPVFLYMHIDMVQCCAISLRQHLKCDCLCAQCILQHQHESTSSMQVGSLHKLTPQLRIDGGLSALYTKCRFGSSRHRAKLAEQ